MSRRDLRLVIGMVLAVLVPTAVLDASAGEARRAAGLSAAPFAWRRVLMAHLAAAVPLKPFGRAITTNSTTSPSTSSWRSVTICATSPSAV